MRPFVAMPVVVALSNTAYADKLIMVCSNVEGQRVDFVFDTMGFEDGEDGFANAKHVVIFDENLPDVVSVKWQAAIPSEFVSTITRKHVDEIMEADFVKEPILMRNDKKFTTVYRSEKSVFTALYDFANGVILTTRLTMDGMGTDMAAYYKGRCERIS
jgi:hypothetical protein